MVLSKIKNKLRIYYIQSKELLSSRAKKASSTETDLLKSYSCANISDQNPDNRPKQIIYMADGKLRHGGLADRLRGIITLYDYCKKHNIEFKIHFVSPFQLKDFLEPSGYDWTINPDDITYDSNYSHPVLLDTYAWDPKMEKLYERIFAKIKLKQHYRQLHVYTNYLYAENKFGELFNELFTPSKTLQSYLDNEYNKIQGEYISVSTRFLNILGDFNETYQGHEYLTPDEKIAEANRVIELITPLFDASQALTHDESVSSIATHVMGGYLALTQECRELIDFAQTGSEENRNEFFRLNEVASEEFHDAQDLLNQ